MNMFVKKEGRAAWLCSTLRDHLVNAMSDGELARRRLKRKRSD